MLQPIVAELDVIALTDINEMVGGVVSAVGVLEIVDEVVDEVFVVLGETPGEEMVVVVCGVAEVVTELVADCALVVAVTVGLAAIVCVVLAAVCWETVETGGLDA